jgi:very-short-patch-repair endonuclease
MDHYRPHRTDKREEARRMCRAMTSAEAALWQHLRASQLDGLHFRRQQIIDGFITDFYCHSAGLVIEVDGEIHLTTEEYDRERDRILNARGLRVLRLTNDQIIGDLPRSLSAIRDAIPRIPLPLPSEEGGWGVRTPQGAGAL